MVGHQPSGESLGLLSRLWSGVEQAILSLRKRVHGPVYRRRVKGSMMQINLSSPISEMDRALGLYGVWEPEVAAVYQDALQTIGQEHDSVCVLDIGSSIGFYPLLAGAVLGDAGTIIALEPGPKSRGRLRHNIALNDYDIRALPVAASDTIGMKRLDTGSDELYNRIANTGVAVGAFTVDSLLKTMHEVSKDPVVIRMDVQGHEKSVLKGMERLLSSNRPLYCMVEIHDSEARRYVIERFKGAELTPSHAFDDRLRKICEYSAVPAAPCILTARRGTRTTALSLGT